MENHPFFKGQVRCENQVITPNIPIWLMALTCFNHLEKYESVGSIIPIYYGKITNVPNHQPVIR
jgi:hypothetical protein